MTMFITVATANRIVQASDRRITWFKSGKAFKSDDDTNKAVIVDCHNGRFSIVYSGLAKIEGRSTESIIADIFRSINKQSPSPQMLFDTFVEKLAGKFRTTGIPSNCSDVLKTDISVAGYLYSGDVFWLRVSNHKDKEGTDIGLQDTFSYYGRLIDNPSYRDRSRGVYAEIGGISDVQAKRLLEKEILRLRRSRFFHRTNGQAVANRLVDLIRVFSQPPESQNLVGKNCMTTVLNAPPATQHSFCYHDVGNAPVQYGPEFVFEDGGFTNFEAGPLR